MTHAFEARSHAFEARFITAKEFIVVFIFCDVCFLCTWPKTLIRVLLDFLVRFSRAFCTCRATSVRPTVVDTSYKKSPDRESDLFTTLTSDLLTQ